MRRREFIAGVGGAAATVLTARAQQPTLPVIAFFNAGSPATTGNAAVAFRQGLRDAGFVDSQNVAIEYHWADDQYDRLQGLAADLAQRRIAVIAASPRAAEATKAATTTIPVVFMGGTDPVRSGLVQSLNRPGGNLTGVSILSSDLAQKRFGVLYDLVPQTAVVGILVDSTNPRPQLSVQDVRAAAQTVGVQTRVMSAATESELEGAFAAFAREGVRALLVGNGLLFLGALRSRLAALAARYRIPACYELRENVDAGGLMSYGPSLVDAYRQVGRYVARILKGEKPADLPVILPTKFELVINLTAAKTLGLTIPPGVLALADEVIE